MPVRDVQHGITTTERCPNIMVDARRLGLIVLHGMEGFAASRL